MKPYALLAAAGLFVGCAGPPAPSAPSTKPVASGTAPVPVTLDNLRKGMTAAEIVGQWGKPDEQRTLQTAAGAANIWVYRRVVHSYQRQVATSTQLVPVFDPLTGGVKEMPEVVYSQELVETVRTSELLVFQDHLVDWKVSEENQKRLF